MICCYNHRSEHLPIVIREASFLLQIEMNINTNNWSRCRKYDVVKQSVLNRISISFFYFLPKAQGSLLFYIFYLAILIFLQSTVFIYSPFTLFWLTFPVVVSPISLPPPFFFDIFCSSIFEISIKHWFYISKRIKLKRFMKSSCIFQLIIISTYHQYRTLPSKVR